MGRARERGLPAHLTISVPEEVLHPPSHVTPLRDFLDQAIATRQAADRVVDVRDSSGAQLSEAQFVDPAERLPRLRSRARLKPRSSGERGAFPFPSRAPNDDRLQLRMTSEARQSLESLVEHFARYGPNKRTPASDIIGALILALADALRDLDLGQVPRRGAYGTPSAEAHRVHMKHAVADAIARCRTRVGEV